LRTTLGKAIVAWLPTLLAWGVSTALAMGVVRPFLFEAFVVPENSMAPTILGRHLVGTCPTCGGSAYVSAAAPADHPLQEELGICGRCRKASNITVAPDRVFSGDRLIAAKFLPPRRGDVIVFRLPEDPSIPYAKRVVGLPGEQVKIKDGDVWINGARAAKPPEISGLVYVAHPIKEEQAAWGPARLGRDEFFVLGDFSRRSNDSRLWTLGAPGHSPYAVPKSYVVGVVTHTYWPPSRWRIFR
jgi:signal peptidase I